MSMRNDGKLNQLFHLLPEGLLVDSAWLRQKGYSTSLCSQYVAAGWLERPSRRVYRRPTKNKLTWQQVVISLQAPLNKLLVVGGRTALELQGMGHYLSQEVREVHLYGPEAPPTWLGDLQLGVRFIHHTGKRLFRNDPITRSLTSLASDIETKTGESVDPIHGSFRQIEWGHLSFPLTVSAPERALLELLDELPKNESFHQVDKLMEGMSTLSPRRLKKLLADCHSVKVKRLFFFFAERHHHRWLNQLEPESFGLGTGNRVLVKGGKLNRRYHITVPEDLDGLS
jgi:Transcriptional regulator, AbiEi antitoxin, Type IV TA system/Transcriptional regulator, AbiEi antitoxin N-terminal domain